MPSVVAIALCAGVFGASAMAQAAPNARFIYLRGEGAETCPSEREVQQAVQMRLGYDPFSLVATSTMFAEVGSVNGGYTASLKLVDANNTVRGDRVLRVQGNCAELMDAMALTISIAIDPMSVTRNDATRREGHAESERADQGRSRANEAETESEPSGAPPPAPTPRFESSWSSADETLEEPAAPKVRASRSTGHVSLSPLVSLGSAPSLSVGGALAFEAGVGRLVGAIEGRGDLPSSSRATGSGRVVSSLLSGALFAGMREGVLFGGIVGMVGQLKATSSDVDEAREQSGLLVATGVRVGLAMPISESIEARARAEILANLQRHTLEISGREVYEYPAALGSVGLGVAVRFW